MKVCGRTGYRTPNLWLLSQKLYLLCYVACFYGFHIPSRVPNILVDIVSSQFYAVVK